MTQSQPSALTAPARGTLALVESPAQLLNVIELGEHQARRFRAAVLAPATGTSRTQLRTIAALARGEGHEVTWHEPRQGGAAVARTVSALTAALHGVDELIVGDAFSGVIQVIIAVTKPAAVTLVDDGSATIAFARQWVDGDRLHRWHDGTRPARHPAVVVLAREQIADTVRARLAADHCRLAIFSSLAVEVPGVAVLRNDYRWVRRSIPTPALRASADLVGTSLVETGVVSSSAYLGAVARIVGDHGVRRYFAHRREEGAKLDAIEALGVEVVVPALPLEIAARQGPVGSTMITFPSTVAHTLPLVLADRPVEFMVQPVEPDWYLPRATPSARRFLDDVTTAARRRFGLAVVS